jgi:hypothetical protein
LTVSRRSAFGDRRVGLRINSGLVAFGRSSACADETGFCISSAQADDRRGLHLPAEGAGAFPAALRREFIRPPTQPRQLRLRGL